MTATTVDEPTAGHRRLERDPGDRRPGPHRRAPVEGRVPADGAACRPSCWWSCPSASAWPPRAANSVDVTPFLDRLPADLAAPITSRPPNEQLVLLVNGYLLAPLFLIVPLMVSAVLAADAFAGEKERRTLESLLHLPVSDRDLFVAKLLVSFLPALAVSWIGFVCFAIVSNGDGVADRPPGVRPHPALDGDDPVGGARRGRPGSGRHGAGLGPGVDRPGGEPARRCRDPAAHLPGHGSGDRACCWSTSPSPSASGRSSGSSPSG